MPCRGEVDDIKMLILRVDINSSIFPWDQIHLKSIVCPGNKLQQNTHISCTAEPL